jgi:hypothetical protein
MEIGATVCRPTGAPDCKRCPLQGICGARRLKEQGIIADIEGVIPLTSVARPKHECHRAACVIIARHGQSGGARVLLARRPAGLLGAMWGFPTLDPEAAAAMVSSTTTARTMRAAASQALGAATHVAEALSSTLDGAKRAPRRSRPSEESDVPSSDAESESDAAPVAKGKNKTKGKGKSAKADDASRLLVPIPEAARAALAAVVAAPTAIRTVAASGSVTAADVRHIFTHVDMQVAVSRLDLTLATPCADSPLADAAPVSDEPPAGATIWWAPFTPDGKISAAAAAGANAAAAVSQLDLKIFKFAMEALSQK